MKVLIAVGGAVVLWGVATLLVVDRYGGPVGAESAQTAADRALHALSTQDAASLLKLASPELEGREAAAQQLTEGCRGSNFEGAGVKIRGGFGDRIAWGDITVPRGKGQCRMLTMEMVRRDRGWFLSLGSAEPGRNPLPTAATDR